MGLNIQKECGADNICIPNLSIQTKEIDSYLMGSGERLEIQTVINNSGEDAFNAVLEVQLPRGVSYINANTTDTGINILCSPPTPLNNNTVQCEVGNPLRSNREITTRVFVQPSSEGLEDPVSEFSFAILAKSSNPEEGSDDGDNWATYTVPIRVETDFRVTGKSTPAQVEYNISAPLPDRYDYEDEIGEPVNHIYDVKNRGPSSISEAEVYILWPSFNEYGDHLLYLLGFDYDRKKAFCEPIKNLNPLAVTVQGSRDYAFNSAQVGEQSASFGSSSSSSSGSSSSSSSSSGSSSSSHGEGFGGRSRSFSEEEDDSIATVVGAARGPGGYHGTMSKAELEREAGGPVFSSSGSQTQVENTRYQGQAKYQPPVVAEGAEETRLFDTQGQLSASAGGARVVKKVEASGSSSGSASSSSSGSSSGSSGSTDKVYSGWRLLDNGTYIRVYDAQSAGAGGVGSIGTGAGFGQAQGGVNSQSSGFSSQSSSSQEVKLTGSTSGGLNQGSVNLDVSGNSIEDGDEGSHNTGWVRQPDGTFIRKQSSWSSWSSSSGGAQGQGGESGGGYSSQRGQASEGRQMGGGYSSGGGHSSSSGSMEVSGAQGQGGASGGGYSSERGQASGGSQMGGGYSSGGGHSSSLGSMEVSATQGQGGASGGAY